MRIYEYPVKEGSTLEKSQGNSIMVGHGCRDKHCNLKKDLGWGLEDGKRTDLCRNNLTVPWVYVYFCWKCRTEMFP